MKDCLCMKTGLVDGTRDKAFKCKACSVLCIHHPDQSPCGVRKIGTFPFSFSNIVLDSGFLREGMTAFFSSPVRRMLIS